MLQQHVLSGIIFNGYVVLKYKLYICVMLENYKITSK